MDKTELSLEKYTKIILEENGIFLKKNLGQNFLINQNIIDRIIEVSNISENDIVLEIGPGIGALTKTLVKHAKHVIAVEIDKRFINVLNNTLKSFNNFTLINEDILKIDIDQLILDIINKLKEEELKEDKDKTNRKNINKKYNIKVVANLPYYISTPILINLIKSEKIEKIYIMLQKELAERFSSKTGTRDSSSITYYISYYTEVKKEINISRNNFKPVPKVDSQVISFKKRKYEKEVKDEELLFKLIKIGFMQRRKTYLNNFKSYSKLQNKDEFKISVDDINKIFIKLGIDLNVRAEQITLDQYIDIVNMI